MKLKKKFVVSALTVAMIASTLQFPVSSVQAAEWKQETVDEFVVMEETNDMQEDTSEEAGDLNGTEVEESETNTENMNSQTQEGENESNDTEGETKKEENETIADTAENDEDRATEEIVSETDEEETEEVMTSDSLENNDAAEESSEGYIAEGSYEGITWSINIKGKLLVEGTGDFSKDAGVERAPWHSYGDKIKTAEIKVTGMTDASYMFSGCNILTGINIKNFDTSGIISMKGMFLECSKLSSLSLNNLDIGKVTDMSNMFSGCSSLRRLNLSGFVTSQVTDMSSMFSGCRWLSSLSLKSFETGKVTDMSGMFSGCSSLRTLDLSHFNTSEVINMKDMFSDCSSLGKNISKYKLELNNFDTSKVTNMSNMFSGCSSLGNVEMDNFNTGKVTDMSSMFSDCSNLSGLNLSSFNTSEVTDMSSMFSGCSSLSGLNLSSFNTSEVTDMSGMFSNCSGLYSLGLSNFDTGKVTNMSSMFLECGVHELNLSSFDVSKVISAENMILSCSQLVTIETPRNLKCQVALPPVKVGYSWYLPDETEITELPQNLNDSVILVKQAQKKGCYQDIKWNLDSEGKLTVEGTGEFLVDHGDSLGKLPPWYSIKDDIKSVEIKIMDATDISRMFYKCTNLTSVDFSNFNFQNVENMSELFCGCSSLKSMDFVDVNIPNIKNMNNIFKNCYSLTSVKFSNVNTQEVSDLSGMFWGCKSLINVDLGGLSTQNVEDISRMFSGCSGLTNINLSSLDTQKVKNMQELFSGCSNLYVIDLSSFNTQNVEDMGGMFSGCSSLSGIDLSSLDTQKVKNMQGLFRGCSNLRAIDLSSFNTQNVNNMSSMFSDCLELAAIDLSPLNTQNVEYMNNMFSSCRNLTDIDLSPLDTQNVEGMSNMFSGCWRLKDIDVSPLDTKNVSDMSGMFRGCQSLTSLDLSSFNTENVASMSMMFLGCNNLTNINLSNFDARNVDSMKQMFSKCSSLISVDLNHLNISSGLSDMSYLFSGCSSLLTVDLSNLQLIDQYEEPNNNAINMEYMFADCNKLSDVKLGSPDSLKISDMSDMFSECNVLKNLELYNLDTCNVNSMGGMFNNCYNLIEIDLSSFNTSNLQYTGYMFSGCRSLVNIDLSGFVTQSESTENMFSGCSRLKSINLSGFNMESVQYVDGMLENCIALETIITPHNLRRTIELPGNLGDLWYTPDGTVVVELPQELDHSIVITKNKLPDANTPHITASKRKTLYQCGDILNITDLTVTYYDSDGTVKKVTDYTTNAKEIDMSVPGTKKLIITYNELQAEVELTVQENTQQPTAKEKVVISGIEMTDSTYTGKPVSFGGVIHITSQDGDKDLTDQIELTYSYSGKQADQSDYIETENPPINAGQYVLKATVSEDNKDYTGSVEYSFNILPAPIEITALDMVFTIGDAAPASYEYQAAGLLNDDKLVREPVFSCDADMEKEGVYEIIPSDADAGMNYEITYHNGKLTVTDGKTIGYTVVFDLSGHGTEIAPVTNLQHGSLLEEPKTPIAEGYLFIGWYQDEACTKAWDFNKDMVEEDTVLYACWLTETTGTEGTDLCIQEIRSQTYTGKAVKPAVLVYSADGKVLLKAGKDYNIKYYNNIEADMAQEASMGGTSRTGHEGEHGFSKELAYVVITGKGNYTGGVYRNFHITSASIADQDGNPAQGVTLKYKEQIVSNDNKAQKPFSSLKYKKNLKAGVDFEIQLTAVNAYDAGGNVLSNVSIDENSVIPSIPAGYKGTFLMSVRGINNYSGIFNKTIYVSDKSHLLKNAVITLGKNQKSMQYTGGTVTLTPAYFDASTKRYYAVDENGIINTEAEQNGNHVFTVRAGKEYLTYGKDYTVMYANNDAVGTAVMTIIGMGDYIGTKSVAFKITGTDFTPAKISIENFQTVMTYTGKALMQDNVVLKDNGKVLVRGKDYTVSYKNNLKKGMATMIFTAQNVSGYSGSFKKTYKIEAAELKDIVTVETSGVFAEDRIDYGAGGIKLEGNVIYTREGAKPSDRILLTNGSIVLKEGSDYTVSYTNNKAVTSGEDNLSAMNIKGKGNYTGNLTVNFQITEADMEGNENLSVTAAAMPFNGNKAENYQYRPKIKLMDGKRVLSASSDYSVVYKNCSQPEVKAYLEALETGKPTEGMVPYAVITAKAGSGYAGNMVVELNLYEKKLAEKQLYVVVSEEVTYTGKQVRPQVTVYYGMPQAVKAAKREKETDFSILTDDAGNYRLTKLEEAKDYTLAYGTNITAGRNKGGITVIGKGLYGGRVTAKFTILRREVYMSR